ncbi:hypothetical protein FOMPIDRAFT_1028722 [Fomitopsis schrenkii]|uniref:Yeast cell wall synthesis Kre9/Knh1-like N-terminal domain-containing protein n=1 Tax=Fomitopsis schrenkii TaxID=2126942 RepID=S8EJF5_FOMSC|nr:hypothetical protein FOMPIDRAFT_1028722 [Fomitopsis schrenkii]
MFPAISALVALAPFAAAFVLETPTNWQTSSTANISWSTSAGDPSSFSFELVNPEIFHNSYAIGSNIQASQQFFSFEMPTVDIGAGYYLEAVNVTNIGDVYARSGEFSIAAAASTSSSSASSTASSASSSGASSGTSSVSATSSGSSTSASSASTVGSSSTSAGAAAETSNNTFNGASRFDINLGSIAVAAIGAVAGAIVAL